MHRARAMWHDITHHDSVLWRKAMAFGVLHGPEVLVQYSPPVFGAISAALLPRHRAAVRRNLRLVHGQKSQVDEALDVARVFASFAGSLTDAFVASTGRRTKLRVRCRDESVLRKALDEGQGVIVATAHTGGFQIASASLEALLRAEVLIVMRRERDARAQVLQDSARERAGVRVVHVGDDARDALPLLAHLKRGGVVALQVDRLPQGMRGRKSELFGQPFFVPEGPLRLAAVSRAPIVPVFTRRLGYMDYDVQVAAPVHLPRRPTEADLDASARSLLAAMEAFVRANPTQWFHFE